MQESEDEEIIQIPSSAPDGRALPLREAFDMIEINEKQEKRYYEARDTDLSWRIDEEDASASSGDALEEHLPRRDMIILDPGRNISQKRGRLSQMFQAHYHSAFSACAFLLIILVVVLLVGFVIWDAAGMLSPSQHLATFRDVVKKDSQHSMFNAKTQTQVCTENQVSFLWKSLRLLLPLATERSSIPLHLMTKNFNSGRKMSREETCFSWVCFFFFRVPLSSHFLLCHMIVGLFILPNLFNGHTAKSTWMSIKTRASWEFPW